jgi:hypothetical protein
MSQKLESAIAMIGIDIGKNSFHIVSHDERGAAEVVSGPAQAPFADRRHQSGVNAGL